MATTNRRVYTAFGELVEMTGTGETRYGYAGAWGYQEHDADGTGGPDNILGSPPTGPAIGEVLPFLHVGWRYYDPSTGRFLQRDPIGIRGALNVYVYVFGSPTVTVDPTGLLSLAEGIIWITGGPTGSNWWSDFWDGRGPVTPDDVVNASAAIAIGAAAGYVGAMYVAPACVAYFWPAAPTFAIHGNGLYEVIRGKERYIGYIVQKVPVGGEGLEVTLANGVKYFLDWHGLWPK